MKYILLLLFISFSLTVGAPGLDVEVDSNGEVIPSSSQQFVTVVNKMDKSIQLFWDAPGSNEAEDVRMFDIEAKQTQGMNTFPGHSFYGKIKGETEPAGFFMIHPKTTRYSIGSDPATYPTINEEEEEALKAAVGDSVLIKGDNSPVKIMGYRSTAMSAKFRCLTPFDVDYYYDDGGEGTFQGTLSLGKETTTNTYEGHVFYFTRKGKKNEVVNRFPMNKDRSLYIIMDEKQPPPEKYMSQWKKEEQFMEEYYNRTGLLWRHFYGPNGPRNPPILHMWPAEKIGDIHTVTSNVGIWSCVGKASDCQSKEPINMELEVISLAPRAFYIPHFLSDWEAEHIIDLARPQIKGSQVGDPEGGGAGFSDTRTSRNAWVSRGTDGPTESLYLRAADLLVLDEKMLNSNTNAEDMQVVHYVNGQKYDSHHDWGVSGYPESRLITLLLYLTNMEGPGAGGETAFPKGADGLGFKVEPRKGSAVLFYNLLEDGNGDDLALHAALPVWKGEKWLANFWVWDPKRK